jgi:hypothetical protein
LYADGTAHTSGFIYRQGIGDIEEDDLQVGFGILRIRLTADGYRMYQQKFLSAAIIAVLVILIIIVLWSKLRG